MLKRTPKSSDIAHAEGKIADAAEAYPNVIEAGPWGHRAFKIQGKTFLFLAADGDGLSCSVKLPTSGKAALSLSFTEPTHYGLGKSGWVTARFAPGDHIPVSTVIEWVDESFRAIAPKRIVGALADSTPSPPRAARDKASAPHANPRRVAARKSVGSTTAVRKAGAKNAGVKNAGVKKAGVKKAGVKKAGVKKKAGAKKKAGVKKKAPVKK